MSLDAFPEIESFQKLPRQVIVKAGGSSFSPEKGAFLQGLVINNIGHDICGIKIHLVVLNSDKIPVLSTSTFIEQEMLPQGGMAKFTFELPELQEKIIDYHLYTNWRFYE